jgi:sugar/nucleoside kinase (ribokinase family)
MTYDLVGLGSAIVDFVPSSLGVPLKEVKLFSPSAGGAVSNILVGGSRLGLGTSLLGCVGDDEFGEFILEDLRNEKVDVSMVKRVKERTTGIAFYSLDKTGERHYVFYRIPGHSDPESMLRKDDIRKERFVQTKVFHLSESLLRGTATRNTVYWILKRAKKKGVIVSYDPNVRESLWINQEDFDDTQHKVIGFTDILMSTYEEMKVITHEESIPQILDTALSIGPSVVVVRFDERYILATKDKEYQIPIFPVKAVDTSGAGDAFDAGFLFGYIRKWPLDKSVLLGGAVAAIKVSKIGTKSGLPNREEAMKFLDKSKPKLKKNC